MKRHLILSVLFSFLSTKAFAVNPPEIQADTMDIYYQGHYFMSDTNVGDSQSGSDRGEKDTLPNDQSYQNLTNLFEFGYSLTNGLRFSAGGTFAYAESRGPVDDRDNTEFGFVIASAQYAIPVGTFVFIPNARIEYSIPKVEDAGHDDVMTNEAAGNYQFGGWGVWTVWRLRTHGYLAYRIQDDDRANHVLWALGMRYVGNKYWIDGEVSGAKVVVDDGDKDSVGGQISRNAVTQNVNGGSLRYYAVNPEWIDGELSVGFDLNKDMSFAAGAGHTITGENTAYGLSLFARFIMNFDMGDTPPPAGRKSLTNPKGFKPKLEKYDEDLFKE